MAAEGKEAIILTQEFVDALPANVGWVKDGLVTGLYVKSGKRGGRTFYFRGRVNGEPKTVKIGAANDMTLADARNAATSIGSADARMEYAESIQIAEAWELYKPRLAHLSDRYAANLVRFAERFLLPREGKVRVRAFSTGHASALVRHVEGACGLEQAKRFTYLVRPMWNWLVMQQFATENPFNQFHVTLARSSEESRWLTVKERRKLMNWVRADDTVRSPFIRLITLTGIRRTEALTMHTRDMAGSVWNVAGGNRKWNIPLAIPLTLEMQRVILDANPKIAQGGFVFKTAGRKTKTGHMGWSDKQMTTLRRDVGIEDGWSLHTLRHTFATIARANGHTTEQVAMALGHKGRGVSHNYMHESCLAVVNDVMRTVEENYEIESPNERFYAQHPIWERVSADCANATDSDDDPISEQDVLDSIKPYEFSA